MIDKEKEVMLVTRQKELMEPRSKVNKKRKAENSDNERLSKRLSLLNLGVSLIPNNLLHEY